jgi:type II secretory pathway pseudopilin PulG
MCRRRVSGFTLVEIIVVLGIIIMLAGLLFPLIGRAKEAGKRAQCLNNLRSLTQAWIAYAGDNDRHLCGATTNKGWLDKSFPPDPKNNPGPIVRGQLYPYLKSTDPYRCPDDNSDIKFNPCSYAINSRLTTPMRIDDVEAPARTFAFIEQASTGQVIGNVFVAPVYPGIPILSGAGWPGENHHGVKAYAEGTGISFADGHAIFWTYSDPRTGNLREAAAAHIGALDTNSPDVFQLMAWSGGPLPPDPPKRYDPTQPWP